MIAMRQSAHLPALCLVMMALSAVAAETPTRPAPGNSLDPAGVPPAMPLVPPQISVAGRPMSGASDAPVTVVEFIDYECPYCQAFARDTYPRLKADYIDTGKVRYVARDLPLPRHSRARPAAVAAACAGEQGRFWQMHDALFAGRLDEADIERLAGELGLDAEKFATCRSESRHGARLDADIAAARALGVSGTPSFLVGASRGEVAQGKILTGNQDYAEFAGVLERYLAPRP